MNNKFVTTVGGLGIGVMLHVEATHMAHPYIVHPMQVLEWSKSLAIPKQPHSESDVYRRPEKPSFTIAASGAITRTPPTGTLSMSGAAPILVHN